MKMKKWMLATAMATAMMGMTATEAMAEMVTYYCAPYFMGYKDKGIPSASTVISQKIDKEDRGRACDAATDNAWNDYLKANIKDYFVGQIGVLGPYKTFNEANTEYLEQKADALERGESFHHASDFSFQPDI